MSAVRPLLVCDRVSLKASIGSGYILNNISFELNRGDRLAIVGPSGSGKTSLLRLINRLQDSSQGAILLDGQNIQQGSAVELRQRITLVMQESSLLNLSVRETLAYPLQLRQMDASAIQERMQAWIQRLSIPEEWLDRGELNLSMGQRQWVAIARALMTEPEVLLLDEPTAALDVGRSQRLMRTLQHWSEECGITMVMVNHQLSLVESWCTQVLVMRQGTIQMNQPAHQTDWPTIKDNIVQAELKEAEDWGENGKDAEDLEQNPVV